jgi:CRP-like cAMP-binding protein
LQATKLNAVFFNGLQDLGCVFSPREGQLTLSSAPLLSEHRFVRGLAASEIEALAAHAQPVTFEENQVVMDDHERSSAFYLLVSGSVAIELRSTRYALCVQALGPGDIFGWSALLDDQDTVFGVRARERTLALRIDGSKLKTLCRSNPDLGCELLRRTLQVVAGRVRATETRFAEMCGVRV